MILDFQLKMNLLMEKPEWVRGELCRHNLLGHMELDLVWAEDNDIRNKEQNGSKLRDRNG